MKRNRIVYLVSVAVLVAIGVFVFNRTTRADDKPAEYKVVESNGSLEVREYPDLMLVATTTKIDARGRDDTGAPNLGQCLDLKLR